MQLKKLATGVVIVFALFLFGFSVNSSTLNNKNETFASSLASKSTKKKLVNSGQAREYLVQKFGDDDWIATNFTKGQHKDGYWTFIAEKNSENGDIQAGHTIRVHQDGTVNF